MLKRFRSGNVVRTLFGFRILDGAARFIGKRKQPLGVAKQYLTGRREVQPMQPLRSLPVHHGAMAGAGRRGSRQGPKSHDPPAPDVRAAASSKGDCRGTGLNPDSQRWPGAIGARRLETDASPSSQADLQPLFVCDEPATRH